MLTDKTQLITFLHSAEGGNRSPAYDDKQPWKELQPGDEILGTLTYGPGFTTREDGVTPLQIGDTITEQEAFDRLSKYIDEEIEPVLENLIHVPIAPSMANALASLVFNFGASEVLDWRLWGRINAGEEPGAVIREWVNGTFFSKGEPMLGLWRRRTMELLLGFGLDWRAGSNVSWEDDPEDVMFTLGWDGTMPAAGPIHDPTHNDLFENVVTDPTPETPITTADANEMQLESLRTGKPIDYGVPMTKLTKKVPVESVHYLANEDKTPGNITVKPIEDSQRGKGYAKQEQGKQQIIAGAGGTAAVAIGAAEPVLKVVDRYSINTIAAVFLGLTVVGIITYYWGLWQRQRGEDNAEDLLG